MKGGRLKVGRAAKIKVLPSMLVYEDGSERPLADLSPEERKAWEMKFLDRIGEVIMRDPVLVQKLLEKQAREEAENTTA